MNDLTCPLLNLAPELRISIYEHVFSEAVVSYTEKFDVDLDDNFVAADTIFRGSSCHTALFRTCKRIRKEAHPILAQTLLLKINFINNMATTLNIPQALNSYLPLIRYVEFEADTGTDSGVGGLRFDIDKFPNLSSLTYIAPDTNSAAPKVFVDDAEAVAWLEGKHDHALLQSRVAQDADACHFQPGLRVVCQHWYHQLLMKPNRGYRLLTQRILIVSLYCASAIQANGAEGYYGVPVSDPEAIGVRRYTKLVHDADSLDVIATAYNRCCTKGTWNDEIKALCADLNRQCGVWMATPFRIQHERGLWIMPS